MSIAIIGGGTLGLVLALMLSKIAKGNINISLIAQYSSCLYNTSLSLKSPWVIALTHGAYSELMKFISISSTLSICSTIIKKIEISEHGSFSKVFIHAQDYQLSELGYVVELYPIKKKIFDILCKKSNITMYYPATVEFIQYKSLDNVIVLSNGISIVSKLVIATDNSCERFIIRDDIQWIKYDYHQTAVVAEIIMEVPHNGQAFERFTSLGSLAFLPMYGNLNFLIWCIPSKNRKTVSTWNDDKFSQELQNIFGWKLGKILSIGTRYFYDLKLIYANNHISHRLALVGGAAQTIHPIAGQGFNLGMRDIVTLFNIIHQALCNNNDMGNDSVLALYQKSRRLDQYKTIIITDNLVRLFGSDCLSAIITRRLGLFFLENNFFLKRFLIDQFLS